MEVTYSTGQRRDLNFQYISKNSKVGRTGNCLGDLGPADVRGKDSTGEGSLQKKKDRVQLSNVQLAARAQHSTSTASLKISTSKRKHFPRVCTSNNQQNGSESR